MDSWEIFDVNKKSSKDVFYSKLNLEGISNTN